MLCETWHLSIKAFGYNERNIKVIIPQILEQHGFVYTLSNFLKLFTNTFHCNSEKVIPPNIYSASI